MRELSRLSVRSARGRGVAVGRARGHIVISRGRVVVALLALALVAPAGAVAAKPRLRPKSLGVVPYGLEFSAGRYVVYRPEADRLRVIDEVGGATYERLLPRGCEPMTTKFPEVLLSCSTNDEIPNWRLPLIIDIQSGRFITLPAADAFAPRGPGYIPQRDSYTDLGRQWISGSADEGEAHYLLLPVYLNRDTGERRVLQAVDRPALDLDSPTLAPVIPRPPPCKGPGRAFADASARRWLSFTRRANKSFLIYRRCGRKPKLISRCPDGCDTRSLGRKVIAWTGNHSVSLYVLTSGARYTFRFPNYSYAETGYSLDAVVTRKRVLINVPQAVVPRGSGPPTMRLLEVRLPSALR